MGVAESCTRSCTRRKRRSFEEAADDEVEGGAGSFWPAEEAVDDEVEGGAEPATKLRTPEQTPEKAEKLHDGGRQLEEVGACDATHWSPGLPSPLPPAPVSPQLSIYDQVYAQQSKVGLASLHFVRADDCYVSYEAAEASRFPSLDDGSRPPARKAFEGASFDLSTRTFVGSLSWAPTTWDGEARRDYEIVFSADLRSIVGGCIRYYGPGSASIGERAFGRDVWYKKVRVSKSAPGKHASDERVAAKVIKAPPQAPHWSRLGAPVNATTQTSLSLADGARKTQSMHVHSCGHQAEEIIESELDCVQVTSGAFGCCASSTSRTAKMLSCVRWPAPFGVAAMPAPKMLALSIFDMSAVDAPELHESQVIQRIFV